MTRSKAPRASQVRSSAARCSRAYSSASTSGTVYWGWPTTCPAACSIAVAKAAGALIGRTGLSSGALHSSAGEVTRYCRQTNGRSA